MDGVEDGVVWRTNLDYPNAFMAEDDISVALVLVRSAHARVSYLNKRLIRSYFSDCRRLQDLSAW